MVKKSTVLNSVLFCDFSIYFRSNWKSLIHTTCQWLVKAIKISFLSQKSLASHNFFSAIILHNIQSFFFSFLFWNYNVTYKMRGEKYIINQYDQILFSFLFVRIKISHPRSFFSAAAYILSSILYIVTISLYIHALYNGSKTIINFNLSTSL